MRVAMRATPRTPIRLIPTFHERPWGVASLAPWCAREFAAPVGEAWFTAAESGTPGGDSLGALIAADPEGVLGTAAFPGHQPLLLKFLFTSAPLSVQVHPGDDYARQHHGCAGKTEAWHVLAAEPGAVVGLGFDRDLSPGQAREAALSGAIERLLTWHPARPGDTFLVPAGTVHAIGAGLTILEIQEPSDITYRLYDYGRPRELHLEHGLRVARLGPYEASHSRTAISPGRQRLAACTFFALERVIADGPRAFEPGAGFYHLAVVLDGSGAIEGVGALRRGDALLVPAGADRFTVETTGLELLVAYTAEEDTPALTGW